MKQYILAHRNGIEGLELKTDVSIPPLRDPKDIRINIKCLSLNARDLQIATNDYPAPHDVPKGVVPVSDGSGIVEAVGEAVTLFKVGDRVAPVFPQGHDFEEDMALRSLKRGLGGGIDGVATEYFVCNEEEAVHLPAHFTFAEGSTLAVAYTTAWSSLFSHSPKLQPGQTVLCLGTGGVSLCAAQLALIAGARVILTSSSQAKLDRAVTLLGPLLRVEGAADTLQTIGYSKVDDWDVEAKRLNRGMGVDFVIEIAGRGTIGRSIRSTRQGGLIAVSGYMSTYSHIPDEIYKEDIAKTILYSAANVRGVFVCNREEFKRMSSALAIAGVHPVIDKTFKFEEMQDAYRYMQEGRHFGKVCVEV